MINQSWQPRVESAVDRLTREFAGIFATETIRRCALESLSLYRDARIFEFVPLLV